MKTAIIHKSSVLMEGQGNLLKDHFEISQLWNCTSVEALPEQYADGQLDLIIIGINNIRYYNNLAILETTKALFPAAEIVVIGDQASLPFVLNFLRLGASRQVN